MEQQDQEANHAWKVALGARLRSARLRARLTQAAAARCIGRSDRSINRWELGQVEPSVSALLRMAEAYRTSMDELAGRRRDQHDQND